MEKCDVIIPVYKSPEWVKLCVYALFKNTPDDVLGNVYLINDCNDDLTINLLNNLKEKYSKVIVMQNEENLGFIKTTNRGLKESTSEYALLLNTDCIISNNTIPKLIKNMKIDKNIGLICPISNNAANLSLPMFKGFTYMQMNNLLEKKFGGKIFDACTIVGNCLMITRECLNKVGYLDEVYGMGYAEETDYQFKAMQKGFKAKVAIDTYVFHKAEVSFGNSQEKQECLDKNRDLFFKRWGRQYNELLSKYKKNNPIKYIENNLTDEDKKNEFNFLIYLIGLSQNAGGVHMSVDMINYLVINNIDCNLVYGFSKGYDEIMLFNPILINDLDKYKFKLIVSTLYLTTYLCKRIADKYNVPLIYFAQGYEPYFENGNDYAIAELSYKLPDKILTISDYLSFRYKDMFDQTSTIISNGINYDLLHKKNTSLKPKVITISLRNNYLKGDFILLDLIKKITKKYKDLEINIMYATKTIKFPFNDNKSIKINKYLGPLNRKEIANIFQQSDIFIDCSLTEGFGLMALEAMTAGNVAIVSNSGGINEYIDDGINGFIVNDVNNVYSYIKVLDKLLNDTNIYKEIKNNSLETIAKYDYDYIVEKYMKFFNEKTIKQEKTLSKEEKELYEYVLNKIFKTKGTNSLKSIAHKVLKKLPEGVKNKIKRVIEKLYNFVN